MAETQIVKVAEEKMYPVSYVIGALVAGLIIGVLLSTVWFKTETTKPLTTTGTSSTREDTSSDTTTSDTTTKPVGVTTPVSTQPQSVVPNTGALLSVEDQPAGLQVAIASAQVSSDQWVVVREAKNGQPGNVLGAARFVGGATSGTVELLRETVAGQMYFGVIYKDNGDRLFSLVDDTPLLDETGNSILVSFTAR